jgi:hypothetical protein
MSVSPDKEPLGTESGQVQNDREILVFDVHDRLLSTETVVLTWLDADNRFLIGIGPGSKLRFELFCSSRGDQWILDFLHFLFCFLLA